MVLRIFGNPRSACSRRVLTVLEELSVPYELSVIDLQKGEQKLPENVIVHPFGQTPYIDDEGFKLFESRAIARYLALKHGGIGKLIPDPKDLQKTALFEQGVSIEQSNFDPMVAELSFEILVRPVIGQATDLALVERLKAKLESNIAGYEVLLTRQKYIGGDEFTLADIFHLSYGTQLKDLGIDFLDTDKYPHVKRWFAELISYPSWKKVVS